MAPLFGRTRPLAVFPGLVGGMVGWRRLLFWSLVGIPILFIVLIPFIGFSTFLIPIIVTPAIAAFFVRRGGRGAVIFGLVVIVLLVFLNGPFFIAPALALPASTGDFISAAVLGVLVLLGLTAAIAMLMRGDETSDPVRRVVWAAAGVVVIAVAVALVARLVHEDSTPQRGDVRLTARGLKFSTDQLNADGGRVAVFVDNKDQTLHTFTIDELDVNLQVPAASKERITFDAPAGRYRFYCVPHESVMKGTLVVR
jgi:plastocyanin